mgnify:CR=1 FL=1
MAAPPVPTYSVPLTHSYTAPLAPVMPVPQATYIPAPGYTPPTFGVAPFTHSMTTVYPSGATSTSQVYISGSSMAPVPTPAIPVSGYHRSATTPLAPLPGIQRSTTGWNYGTISHPYLPMPISISGKQDCKKC